MLFFPNATPDIKNYIQWDNDRNLIESSTYMIGPFNFDPVYTAQCLCKQIDTYYRNCLQEICENYLLTLPTTAYMYSFYPKITTKKVIKWKASPPDPSLSIEDNVIPHQAPNKKYLRMTHCSAQNISEDHNTHKTTYIRRYIRHLTMIKLYHTPSSHIKNHIFHILYYIFITHH